MEIKIIKSIVEYNGKLYEMKPVNNNTTITQEIEKEIQPKRTYKKRRKSYKQGVIAYIKQYHRHLTRNELETVRNCLINNKDISKKKIKEITGLKEAQTLSALRYMKDRQLVTTLMLDDHTKVYRYKYTKNK